jgi:prepilin-type N-terminal cleavage/methylation domain-containing protein
VAILRPEIIADGQLVGEMKKRNTKGFTLIEIILSLAIFAIISVGFLGMFSSVSINTFNSTKLTENAFLAQQGIEDHIASVKSDLERNIAPAGLTSTTKALFTGTNARTVVVYHVQQNITTGQVLETYVSQTRPPTLQTPNITSPVTIAAFSGTTNETYPNIGMPNLSLDLGNELVVDNPGLLIRYLYYWYISNPGYYIASSPPTFPDEYQIITDHTSRLISQVPAEYAGRFIKLVVTPVGEHGQMGTSVESNALYISTMPLNDNVILHLDANYINKDDATQIRTTTVAGKVYNYIKKWNDIGSLGVNLAQATTNSQPLLYQYTIGSGVAARDVLGTLGFAGGTNMNLLSSTTPNIGSRLNMTVYFVAKIDDAFPDSTTIFQTKSTAGAGNRWLLSTDVNDQLVLVRYLANTTAANTWTLVSSDLTYRDSTWKIFKLSIWANQLAIEVDGVNVGSANFTTTTQTIQFTDFKINFDSNLTLGEVIVFDTIQTSGSAESTAIYKYLNDKYKPQ